MKKEHECLQKGMIESTFVKNVNKNNNKNMVAGCIYERLKQIVPDFLNNYILSLLIEKISHENKQIPIMGAFDINLNYNNKNTANFLESTKLGKTFLIPSATAA